MTYSTLTTQVAGEGKRRSESAWLTELSRASKIEILEKPEWPSRIKTMVYEHSFAHDKRFTRFGAIMDGLRKQGF